MKESQIIWCFYGGILLFLMAFANPVFARKPLPPISLFVQTEDRSDGAVEITLHAVANMKIESAELSFHLPESLRNVKTEKWVGAIDAGKTQHLKMTVNPLSEHSEEIIGEAIVHWPDGSSFVQRHGIRPNAKVGPEIEAPAIKRKQEGQNIIEFKGY